jgi:hypothetical protein
MALKTSAPGCYNVSNTFKTEPELANAARNNVGGKAKHNFAHTPQMPNKTSGGPGAGKTRAYNTNSTPDGSGS